MSELIFRFRGFLLAPYGLLILIWGKPSPVSFWVGLTIALIGEGIRFWGVGYVGKTTRKSELDAPWLVSGGPYAHVRHPLYVGNSLMGFGGLVMAIGRLSPGASIVFFLVFLLFYGTVYGTLMPLEEEYLIERYGEAYHHYRSQVPRFIPFGKRYQGGQGEFDFSRAVTSEIHTLAPFLILVAVLAFRINR